MNHPRFSRFSILFAACLTLFLVACRPFDPRPPSPATQTVIPPAPSADPGHPNGDRSPTGFYWPTDAGDPQTIPNWTANWLAVGCSWAETKTYAGQGNNYHIGLDIRQVQTGAVFAIADGSVTAISRNTAEATAKGKDPKGWGVGNLALLIEHQLSDGTPFIAVYGHMIDDPENDLHTGKRRTIRAGEKIGELGPYPGGVHLHLGIHPGSTLSGNLGRLPCPAQPPITEKNGFVSPYDWLTTRTPKSGSVLGVSTEVAPTQTPTPSLAPRTMPDPASLDHNGVFLQTYSGFIELPQGKPGSGPIPVETLPIADQDTDLNDIRIIARYPGQTKVGLNLQIGWFDLENQKIEGTATYFVGEADYGQYAQLAATDFREGVYCLTLSFLGAHSVNEQSFWYFRFGQSRTGTISPPTPIPNEPTIQVGIFTSSLLRYNPTQWDAVEDGVGMNEIANVPVYRLDHRTINGCTLRLNRGMGTPSSWLLEVRDQAIGKMTYRTEIWHHQETGEIPLIVYQYPSNDNAIGKRFELTIQGPSQDCIMAAEAVLFLSEDLVQAP